MTRRMVLRTGWLAVGLLFGGLLLLNGCAQRASVPKSTPVEHVGVWQVAVTNTPDPAHVGDNTLVISARDAAGHPLHGSVEAIVGMPAMGAMPYMESRG